MKTLPVEGTLRTVEVTEREKDGKTYYNGRAVVQGRFDKFEVEVKPGSSARIKTKFEALQDREGQPIELLCDIGSGNGFRDEPRFFFVDDLTAPPAKS